MKDARCSADVRAELVGGDAGTRHQRDHGADLLAEDVVRHADDRGVDDIRVLEQHGLDLGAVDVLAAADHDVLGAVEDVDEALVVDPRDVAGCAANRR